MKAIARSILKRLASFLNKELKQTIRTQLNETKFDNEAVAQLGLMNQYRLLSVQDRDRLPGLKEVGFRKYSQFEEDGILLYIFSLVPPVNRVCVEICAGNGTESNTTNHDHQSWLVGTSVRWG